MVHQFTINLNREEGFVQRMERKRRIRDRAILISFSVLLLALAIISWRSDRTFRNIIDSKERQLQRIVAQIDSLQQAGQNVSKEDVLALARLERERVLWTKKLRALAERMPEKMVITRITLQRGLLTIEAMSQIRPNEREFDKVKLFMDRLRATPLFFNDFKDMKFKESKRFNHDDQPLLSFVITCTLKPTALMKRAKTQTTRRGRRG